MEKFILEVGQESSELFTGITRDALMTRQDILNMYNDQKRQEYVKDQSDPTCVECWFNECLDKFFSTKRKMYKIFHLLLVYKQVGCIQ